MKEICNGCTHQEVGDDDEAVCAKAQYYSTVDGYGPFKQGCVCVYDGDLSDEYSPRTGHEVSISNNAATIKKLRQDNYDLKYSISVLESRLAKIIAR